MRRYSTLSHGKLPLLAAVVALVLACRPDAGPTGLNARLSTSHNGVPMVTEAGLSRMYAGIHHRFDIAAGQQHRVSWEVI